MAARPGNFKSPVSNQFHHPGGWATLRPERESNPRVRDLQSLALPLGYQAAERILASVLVLGKRVLNEDFVHRCRVG